MSGPDCPECGEHFLECHCFPMFFAPKWYNKNELRDIYPNPCKKCGENMYEMEGTWYCDKCLRA